MLQPRAVSGLDLVIRNAREAAFQAGRHDIVARLESALEATERRCESAYTLDLLTAEVSRDGNLVKLSRGERALLFALVLLRRPCTRDELVDMLYPHLDALTGANQLKVYIHRVRRRLGDHAVIVFRNESYRLGQNVVADLWEVEATLADALRTHGELTKALRSYLMQVRGRLMRRDLTWFDDREWCTNLERRLTTLFFDVTVRLGESALAAGDVADAIRLALDVSDKDPCDERGVALAIRAELAAGNRAGAVRQYRRYERTLQQEFGASPSSELTYLVLETPERTAAS